MTSASAWPAEDCSPLVRAAQRGDREGCIGGSAGRSMACSWRGGGRLEVSGRITVKGRSRPLTIVVSPTAGGTGFETRFALDRTEFDVRGGSVMGKLIGRQVQAHLVAVPEGATR